MQVEYGNLFGGDVADEYLPKLGAGDNPRLALSIKARTLGHAAMFNVAANNRETGIQGVGDTENDYRLNDGMQVMEILASKVAGKNAEARREGSLKEGGAGMGADAAWSWAAKVDVAAAVEVAAAAVEAVVAQKKQDAGAEAAPKKAETAQKWKDQGSHAKRNHLESQNVALEWSG